MEEEVGNKEPGGKREKFFGIRPIFVEPRKLE